MPNNEKKNGDRESSEEKKWRNYPWSRPSAGHSNRSEEEGIMGEEEKLIDDDDEPLEDEYD